MSDDQIMVIPGGVPAHIDGGPPVTTHWADVCGPASMEVRVGEEVVLMPLPWPDPQPIPGTPYEAYALDEWPLGRFAIRPRGGWQS